jgi:hypothetical protein
MFALLIIGAASIGYGVTALRDPSAKRVARLRSLPMVLVTCAVFTLGTNLWAVNRFLSSEAAEKAADGLNRIAFIGFTEAAQALTLGGLLAFLVSLLRVAAEGRLPKTER